MFLFGVVNCSPDSLHEGSIVRDPAEARERLAWLAATGAEGVDVGGQASTQFATVEPEAVEWERLEPVLAEAVGSADLVSVDTWRPATARRALELGVTVLNAADGMTAPGIWELAAEFRPLVVLPFLNGPNPREIAPVVGDPIDAMLARFEDRLAEADRWGLRDRCLLDPGTGFGHDGWAWEDRYEYQKHVYSNLDRLRVFERPLYIPLPWKDTAQHWELLDIVLARRPEYGRSHDPDKVRAAEARLAAG